MSATGLLGRVDPQRLQVIHQLFPPAPAGGLLFLAWLLAQARGMPCRDGEPEVAVITVQSLREPASRMGWGYDTTHKYVVLFCALGLLMKRRGGGKVELSFALGRYTPPPSLEALDRLIAASRPKVQSYASKVRRRYLQLFGACQHAESPTPHPAESALSDLDKAIQRIQHLNLPLQCGSGRRSQFIQQIQHGENPVLRLLTPSQALRQGDELLQQGVQFVRDSARPQR